MGISCELKTWAFVMLPAVVAAGACKGNVVCKARQIGSPQYTTNLLQCSGPGCPTAIFAPSINEVCLMRYPKSSKDKSRVRIYLSSCAKLTANEGYLLNDTGNVVTWNQGNGVDETLFSDTTCKVICNVVDVVAYYSNGRMLIADQNQHIGTSLDIDCDKAFYVYPSVIPCTPCNESRLIGLKWRTFLSVLCKEQEKHCPWRTRQLALLVITYLGSTLAVGSPERRNDGSYQLPTVEERNGEMFYVRSYVSQAVGASGTIESVTAYTLQLVRSGKYLVADELSDTKLKYATSGSTGLNLQDASEFPDDVLQDPDNRLFIAYNITAYNRTATFFCPLFHRKFCLFYTESGYIRLGYLLGTSASLAPTFENPTYHLLRQFLLPTSQGGIKWLTALRIV